MGGFVVGVVVVVVVLFVLFCFCFCHQNMKSKCFDEEECMSSWGTTEYLGLSAHAVVCGGEASVSRSRMLTCLGCEIFAHSEHPLGMGQWAV